MVDSLFHPLNIFLLGLGGGFLIPLLYRIARPLPSMAFVVALTGMVVISGVSLWEIHSTETTIEILTAGGHPPFSINLRFGLWEGFFSLGVNVVALLGAWHLWPRLRMSYPATLLYLMLVMGINGMIMTRDLFNLFVFLEIVSIGTYGLLGFQRSPEALVASFKYIMATVVASSFFLLGAGLLYHVTGTLNIDEMITNRAMITGPIGITALLFVLSCLVIELKPFPANGWGLDVYETADSGIAALVSVGVSAGIFSALLKLMPLFEEYFGLLALSGGLTFLLSNLVGLKQTNVQRMLGYSSIAQMGLLVLALSLLYKLDAQAVLPLVIGGLFVNHLLAKAGLFWLAGIIRRKEVSDWSVLSSRPFLLCLLALLVVSIAGLPPFPGFWAKWELIMHAAADRRYIWIAVILVGSFLEAVYMFRWFMHAVRVRSDGTSFRVSPVSLLPVLACCLLLVAAGVTAADQAGSSSLFLVLPLCIGAGLCVLEWFPRWVRCVATLTVVMLGGGWIARDIEGTRQLFAVLLLTGGSIITFASLSRTDTRTGFYPLIGVLLLSIASLTQASTILEFYFHWEIVALASYFLVMQGKDAHSNALQFFLFSLMSAYCLVTGFAVAADVNGTIALAAFETAGPDAALAFVLLSVGFLIKAGAIGVHVWMPATHAAAEGDVSAMLSAVITKVAVFGLFMTAYLAIRSEVGLELAHVMGWIGLLTTLGGALMACQQEDMKLMLGYSSMSQIGYIITAIALMSHLGWVTAFYLVANHLMVKGILFLATAAIILRSGTRLLSHNGGLAAKMPLTSVLVILAFISMSGLPPLAGFGGKWLLLSAMVDKGWYGLAVLTVIATLVGFMYMFRFASSFFLSPRNAKYDTVTEAPLVVLLSQFVLLAGILTLSFFPKLFMTPVSVAINPYFASTLTWNGMSLEAIYDYWNPFPIMGLTLAATTVLFALFFLTYKMKRNNISGSSTEDKGVYGFYRTIFTPILAPIASQFWRAVMSTTERLAFVVQQVYTDNGQTYTLYVLYYMLIVVLLGAYGIALG